MAHIRAATTIHNRLNIACGPTHTQIWFEKELYAFWRHAAWKAWFHLVMLYGGLCKRMHGWSTRLLLSPHSAQNTLNMDNDWMHVIFGDREIYKKHGQLWHQSFCGTFGNTYVSNGTQGKHTHNCSCHHNYIDWSSGILACTIRKLARRFRVKSWHKHNLSHSVKPYRWWTSRQDIRNGATNRLFGSIPLASKTPILLSMVSMSSCVLMLVEK